MAVVLVVYTQTKKNTGTQLMVSHFPIPQAHIETCKFTRIPCPKLLLQSQLDEHLERECEHAPVQCPWCSKKVQDKEV